MTNVHPVTAGTSVGGLMRKGRGGEEGNVSLTLVALSHRNPVNVRLMRKASPVGTVMITVTIILPVTSILPM